MTFQVNCLNKGICQTFILNQLLFLAPSLNKTMTTPDWSIMGKRQYMVRKLKVLGYIHTDTDTRRRIQFPNRTNFINNTDSYLPHGKLEFSKWPPPMAERREPLQSAATATTRVSQGKKGDAHLDTGKVGLCKVNMFVSGRQLSTYCSLDWKRSQSKDDRR